MFYLKHPNYNYKSNDNDIALMKLNVPVTYTDKISPICLPDNRQASLGEVGIVTGWVSSSLSFFSFNMKKILQHRNN